MTNLLNTGTLLNKSKTRKLDYQKKGKSFEIDVYELKETKKEGNVTQRSFVRMNNFNMVMTEKTLLNYLYAEGYIDNK